MSAPDAQEREEIDQAQEQLLRQMALKMVATLEEEERTRRISEEAQENPAKNATYDKLIMVQEDLLRTISLMKVKVAEELERGQRITEDKKRDVHDELLRKAAAKKVHEDEEEERKRRIEASKDDQSDEGKARLATYSKLVNVQEDLLKKIRTMKVDAAMKEEQDRRITEDRKLDVHEQLFHAVGTKQADVAMETERQRRVDVALNEEEIKRRVAIANKLLDVQKELLATHQAVKPIYSTPPSEVLEDMKLHFQEELLRKAAQKEAISAMEEERQRRVQENAEPAKGAISDARTEVLESIAREASRKEAKELTEATRQEYIMADAKARAQEDTVRKVHQKEVDKAMDAEQQDRVKEMSGKESPHVTTGLKKEIIDHAKHSPLGFDCKEDCQTLATDLLSIVKRLPSHYVVLLLNFLSTALSLIKDAVLQASPVTARKMSFQDRREFDKFLKFLTAKVVQTVVQSRRGERIKTRSVVNGNDWFNLAIPDDKQVTVELKHSLEGRLPELDSPVCLEITMDTTDGESLVLENWCISLDPRARDISVSVGHSLYPRLSLMLKSVICLSRAMPTYRYSRSCDDGNKFNFRVYCGTPEVSKHSRDFKHVTFASTACPHGTISLSVSYRTSLTLHSDRSLTEPLMPTQQFSPPRDTGNESLRRMDLPFASDVQYTPRVKLHSQHPFSAVLPKEGVDRQESNGTVQSEDEPLMEGLDSLSVTQEPEGFIMVNVGEIKPAFVPRTSSDELSEFLQQCNEEPTLDMFSGEGAMNVTAALELVERESHKET